MTPNQEAVFLAIWKALEQWDREERRMRDWRQILKDRAPQRVTRDRFGVRIPAPRRDAMALFLTDAALTAIRQWEAEP